MVCGLRERSLGGNMPWIINPFTGKMEFREDVSRPPVGAKEVVNLFVNDEGKLEVQYTE